MDLSIGQQAELKLYPNRKFQLAVVVTQLIVLLSFLVLDIDIIRRHLLLRLWYFLCFCLWGYWFVAYGCIPSFGLLLR